MKRSAAAALVLGLLLACAPAAAAQGCAMCRASVEAAGAKQAKVFDAAVLVLLLPTVSIFAGIVFFALRYRFRSGGDDQSPPSVEELLPFYYPSEDSPRPGPLP